MSSNTWKTIMLGDVLEVSNARLGEHSEEPPVFAISKYEGVVLSTDYHDRRVASDKLNTYKVLEPADWAYSTIHIDEGSIARNNHEFRGVVSPMYTIMTWKTPEHEPRYFEYLLRSPKMLGVYADMAQGSIDRRRSLSWKSFASIPVSVPSLDDQRRIVDLLSTLDVAISRSEQAADDCMSVWNRVADQTMGAIDGHVPLGTRATVLGGKRLPKGVPLQSEPNGNAYVRVVDVRDGEINRDGLMFVPESVVQVIDRYRIYSDNVFISIVGTIGQVAVCPQDLDGAFLTENAARIVPGDQVTGQFLSCYLRSSMGRAEIDRSTVGTTQKKLALVRIRTIRIPDLSIARQQEVVETLSSIEATTLSYRSNSDSLRNLRSELFAALLSGGHRIPETYDELMGA